MSMPKLVNRPDLYLTNATVSTFSVRPIYGTYFRSQKNRNRKIDFCRQNRSKSIVNSKVPIAPTLEKSGGGDEKGGVEEGVRERRKEGNGEGKRNLRHSSLSDFRALDTVYVP